MAEPGARERIILIAERLIAERGAEVSLRDIATEAGQRNNSAVHYHFGSRDGLIQAIVARRQGALEARRMALLAEFEHAGHADDVASLIEILVRPMFDTPYVEGSTHYARFLERVRGHRAIADVRLAVDNWPTVKIVTTRLQRALPELPPATRARRLSAMATVMFGLLADAERRSEDSSRSAMTPAAEDEVGGIVDMLVGMLTAPPRQRMDRPLLQR